MTGDQKGPLGHAPWQFLDDFVLRRAGFPFDLLDGLRCKATHRLLHEAASIDHALTRLEREIFDELAQSDRSPDADPIAPKPRGRVVIRAVKARKLIEPASGWALAEEWNRLVGSWRETLDRARTAFEKESARASARLLELGRDKRLQEAVYLNSPGFYSRGLVPLVEGALRGTRRRSAELTLTSYLQRFCAKNDTSSYFGPINYGRIRRDQSAPSLSFRMAPSGRGRSHAFASHWLVADLFRKAGADVGLRLALPLERSALIRRIGNLVTVEGLPPVRLSPALSSVLGSASKGLSAYEAGRQLGLSQKELEAVVSELERMRLLRLRDEPPADRLDVLPSFRAMIESAPQSKARADLADTACRVDELLRRFESSGLEDRIQLLDQLEHLAMERLQLAPRRGAGGLYADRFLLFDQWVDDVADLTLGGRLATVLSRLETALDLAAWNAREVAAAYRQRAWELVRAAGIRDDTISLLSLLERVPETGVTPASDLAPWRQLWTSLLASRETSARLSLDRSEIECLPGVDLLSWGMVAAPDIMLAAHDMDALERGDFKIVLAEVHPLVVPSQLHFYAYHSEQAAVAGRARQMLERTFDGSEEAILSATRISKIAEAGLGRVRIHQEWLGDSADAEDVAVADLDVELSDRDRCVLRIRGTERRLYLRRPFFLDQPMPAALDLFQRPNVWAADIDAGDHVPRIEVDGVVIQRERWRFGAKDLPVPNVERETLEFFAHVVDWQRRHGLPPLVFARVQGRGEVKPFLIDFASPLSCLALARECLEATGLVVTEMYPGPDELWLRTEEGAFTAELRLSAFAAQRTESSGTTGELIASRLAELRATVAGLHVED